MLYEASTVTFFPRNAVNPASQEVAKSLESKPNATVVLVESTEELVGSSLVCVATIFHPRSPTVIFVPQLNWNLPGTTAYVAAKVRVGSKPMSVLNVRAVLYALSPQSVSDNLHPIQDLPAMEVQILPSM